MVIGEMVMTVRSGDKGVRRCTPDAMWLAMTEVWAVVEGETARVVMTGLLQVVTTRISGVTVTGRAVWGYIEGAGGRMWAL